MSKRALRMRKALESFGWETDDSYEARTCTSCHQPEYRSDAKFCGKCGTKLSRLVKDRSTESQLEGCIAYALRETNKLPGGS